MAVDHLPVRLDRASVARTALEHEMLIGVASMARLMAAQFSPDEPAIAVIIQLQHEIQIAQGDIPLAVYHRLGRASLSRHRHRQREIGVAR